jgi:hypothetical protein
VGAPNRSPSCHDVEDEDSDSLSLLNKPWMKKVIGLLSSFETPIEEYYDYQTPSSRIGGLFLYQSRVNGRRIPQGAGCCSAIIDVRSIIHNNVTKIYIK